MVIEFEIVLFLVLSHGDGFWLSHVVLFCSDRSVMAYSYLVWEIFRITGQMMTHVI